MADPRSAYAVLAESFGVLPTPRVLHELTRRLASETQAVVQVWRARPAGFDLELSWPALSTELPEHVDHAQLDNLPGLSACTLIQDELHTYGAITLTRSAIRMVDERELRRLRETADCILVLWRRDELSAAVHQQNRHTARLADELAESRRRLSTVRELERRRVAMEMFTLSTGRFSRLQRQVRQLTAVVSQGQEPETAALVRLRDLLDELIEDFRAMVRGIHSQVLQDRGPRAALAEVTAGLARATRITGTIPARVDPELAATLYHLTAAAVQALTAQDRDDRSTLAMDPLDVHLTHLDSQLQVLINARSAVSPAALRAALTMDIDRSAAVGGGVQVEVEDGLIRLRAWLPNRLEPSALAPTMAATSLPVRVRELAIALAARYGDDLGSDRVWALVTRLDGPVRLGVERLGIKDSPTAVSRGEWLTSLGLRLPDVVIGPYLSSTGPNDFPDAILRASVEHPEEGADLLLPNAGMLLRSAPWADLPDLLTTELVARTDLIRARSVLGALIVLLREVPPADSIDERLRYELEELQTGAHELAELEALAAIRAGTLTLTPGQVREAERLLGSTGTSTAERLGMTASAEPDELIRAADEHLDRWHRTAEVSAIGPQNRQVFSVIVRTCEGLLADLIVRAPDTAPGSSPRPSSPRHEP